MQLGSTAVMLECALVIMCGMHECMTAMHGYNISLEHGG